MNGPQIGFSCIEFPKVSAYSSLQPNARSPLPFCFSKSNQLVSMTWEVASRVGHPDTRNFRMFFRGEDLVRLLTLSGDMTIYEWDTWGPQYTRLFDDCAFFASQMSRLGAVAVCNSRAMLSTCWILPNGDLVQGIIASDFTRHAGIWWTRIQQDSEDPSPGDPPPTLSIVHAHSPTIIGDAEIFLKGAVSTNLPYCASVRIVSHSADPGYSESTIVSSPLCFLMPP